MVEDVAKAMAWYRDTLGFAVSDTAGEAEAPVWALLRAGDVTLMLEARSSIEAGFTQLAGQPIGATGSLFMGVDDADALYAAIHDKGRVVKEPHLTSYGMREFYIEDPNGYILGFASEQTDKQAGEQTNAPAGEA
jgi:uncharacterized glyoxalase superfamily protein PhnB